MVSPERIISYGKYDSGLRIKDKSRLKIKGRLDKCHQDQLESFVQGIGEISNIILDQKPDLIFSPLRGSAPLVWGLESYNSVLGRPVVQVIPIPTGTSFDIDQRRNVSNTKSHEIFFITRAYLRTFEELYPSVQIKKVAVLDESKKGYSIAGAVREISRVFDERAVEKSTQNPQIIAIKAQDCGTDSPEPTRKNNTSVKWYTVRMAMPQIDDHILLPIVYSQNPSMRDDEHYYRHELLELVDNRTAKSAYKELVRKYMRS